MQKYASWDKAPDAYVNAYFDAEEERKEIEDEEEEEERKEAKDPCAARVVSWVKVKVGDAEAQRIATRQAFWISVMAVIKRAKNNGDCTKRIQFIPRTRL